MSQRCRGHRNKNFLEAVKMETKQNVINDCYSRIKANNVLFHFSDGTFYLRSQDGSTTELFEQEHEIINKYLVQKCTEHIKSLLPFGCAFHVLFRLMVAYSSDNNGCFCVGPYYVYLDENRNILSPEGSHIALIVMSSSALEKSRDEVFLYFAHELGHYFETFNRVHCAEAFFNFYSVFIQNIREVDLGYRFYREQLADYMAGFLFFKLHQREADIEKSFFPSYEEFNLTSDMRFDAYFEGIKAGRENFMLHFNKVQNRAYFLWLDGRSTIEKDSFSNWILAEKEEGKLQEVHGIKELSEFVESLPNSEDYLFRGQKRDYPRMKSSAFRGSQQLQKTSSAYYEHARGLLLDPYGDPRYSCFDEEEFSQIALQHYDHVSSCLDFSSDLKIATWFACTEFRSEQGVFSYQRPQSDEENDRHFRINRRTAETSHVDPCYIYIFKKADLEKFGLISLEEMFQRRMGNVDGVDLNRIRPVCQKGWLAGFCSGEFDYKPLASHVIKLVLSESDIEQLPEKEELYPSASEDFILSRILNSCFNLLNDSDNNKVFYERLISPLEFSEDFLYSDENIRELIPPFNDFLKFSEIALLSDD